MYVDDLPSCSSFKTVLHTDDTYFGLSHKTVHVLKDFVNSELANVAKWMRLNKLSINYSKSVYMLTRSMKYLCSPTELTSFTVHINNVLLQGTACVKYLGALINSRLDWSSHVQLITRKRLYACNILFNLSKFVPIDILRLLNFSFVHCHLKYCVISWGTANNSVLQPLSVLQINILRIMTFSKYRCLIIALYKNLKILKLNDIYQFE